MASSYDQQKELYDLLICIQNEQEDDFNYDHGDGNETVNDSLWTRVREWLERNKGGNNDKNNTRRCLDVLIQKNAPFDVISAFLTDYAAAELARHRDARGWLPLHQACSSSKVSIEVIKLLISKYPKGLRVRDGQQGRLPIHMACFHGASIDVLNLLVDQCPETCRAPDKETHLLPVQLLRNHFIEEQQLNYYRSSYNKAASPSPLRYNTDHNANHNINPIVDIIEKVRRFEFGHYDVDDEKKLPQQQSTEGANTTLTGDDDTQTIVTNATSYTMTTDAATTVNHTIRGNDDDEEITCLETLVQDMFLDQFQQVGQENIVQSYPTPLPTSLVEKMLLPLVGNKEAASVNGNSSLLFQMDGIAASGTTPSFAHHDKNKMSDTIQTMQESLLERMSALSSPAAATATKHPHYQHITKTSVATTTTSSTQPPAASLHSKEDTSFHSSSYKSSSTRQKQRKNYSNATTPSPSSLSMYTAISNQPLPIHIAAEFGCSISLVKALLETYPDGARQIYVPHASITTSDIAETSVETSQLNTSSLVSKQQYAEERKATDKIERKIIVSLRGPVLFPIDCLERGRAGLSYLYTVEKLKERNSKKSFLHRRPSTNLGCSSSYITEDAVRNKKIMNEETIATLFKDLERAFKEFTALHDCIFAFYPDVPTSPRIRVSQRPQYVQTHDVEVLGDPPHAINTAFNTSDSLSYSNVLLRQLAQQYTIAYRPLNKKSAASGNRSLMSLVSPAQHRNRDKQRISRLVQQVRSEAKNSKFAELTSCSALVWMYLCGYTCDMTPTSPSLGHTMFLTSIGRVLFGLDSSAIHKLSFVRSPLDKKGIYVKVLHTNRPVPVEAEKRAPSATMEDILDPSYNIFEISGETSSPESVSKGMNNGISSRTEELASSVLRGAPILPKSTSHDLGTVYSRTGSVRHVTTAGKDTYVVTAPFFWQRTVLSFLDTKDALAFSSSCVRAYATGVRLLPPETIEISPRISLNKISTMENSTFLQDLSFMFPEMTHSLFVDYASSLYPSDMAEEIKSHNDLGGGLLLSLNCRDNASDAKTVSNFQLKKRGIRLKVQDENLFSELSADTYSKSISVRYWLTSQNINLDVSKLQKRQLVYACDAFGDTLLQKLLRTQTSDENESIFLSFMQLLLASGFGNGASSNNLFLMDLALKGANSPTKEILKGGGFSVRSAPNEKTLSIRSRKSNGEDIGSLGKSSAASRSLAVSATYIYKLPLQYYIKNNEVENIRPSVLERLARFCESWLLETDSDRRTPLHNALLVLVPTWSMKHQQHATRIVEVLLSGAGVNALQVKDSGGNLPLHIATAVGAPYSIVELLVRYYADGCYRRTPAGDLPVHLHVMSGNATTSSVELLIAPLANSPSGLRAFSSKGFVLPIHVAVQYQVNIDLLSQLCRTYPLGARETRNSSFSSQGPLEVYALDILEEAREDIMAQRSDDLLQRFNAKSDLLFVYFPDAVSILPHRSKRTVESSDNSDYTGSPSLLFRKEAERIRRLECIIKKEVTSMQEKQMFVQGSCKFSETAYLAWIWLATFRSHDDDPDDNYVENIRRILDGLHYDAVKFLACIDVDQQLFSPPHRVIHLFDIDVTEFSFQALSARRALTVQDCASRECSALLSDKLRFIGRYEFSSERVRRFYEGTSIVHLSEISPHNASLIVRARDFGFAQEYRDIIRSIESSDIDCRSTALTNACETVKESALAEAQKIEGHVSLALLNSFCKGIGLLDVPQELYSSGVHEEIPQSDLGDILVLVTQEMFHRFCKKHFMDDFGVRDVVIKFMSNRDDFEKELAFREAITCIDGLTPVVPVIDNYDGSAEMMASLDSTAELPVPDAAISFGSTLKSAVPFNDRNRRYAIDIFQKHFHDMLGYSLQFFPYAIVMPAAERDLNSIVKHEGLSLIQKRQSLFQVGKCLQALHCHCVLHGNLTSSTVARFQNNQLSFISLADSFSAHGHASFIQGSLNNFIGGASRHWKSSIMPPEMILSLEESTSGEQQMKLAQLDRYWKVVSDDAKDFKLLTTDDAYNLSSTIKKKTVTTISDWKGNISSSLATISFEDLPSSLALCSSFEEFQAAWDRIIFHSDLWERVKPVIHAENSVYAIKAFNDVVDKYPGRCVEQGLEKINEKVVMDAQDLSLLPYDLVPSSEAIDIWMFGLLIFKVCSGKCLFQGDDAGNLCDSSAFHQLKGWDKKTAEKVITANVEDPLAQHLLLLMLVPEDDRIQNMNAVLSHPFFGSASSVEAQYILEKHEELTLMMEETVVIPRVNMTLDTLHRIDNATERHCKIIYDEDKIVVPTAFIVLPYQLEWNHLEASFVAPESSAIEIAVSIGKHLLDINNATARLSFWLMMKKNLSGSDGGVFKSKFKLWLKRVHYEPGDLVAMEIIRDIGCEEEYINVCREVLEKSDAVSNAKAYIRDPMGAAREAIKQSTEALIKCFCSKTLYFYLIDEFTGLPSSSSRIISGSIGHDSLDVAYPLQVIAKNSRLLSHVFMPFMNLATMAVTSLHGGMTGLATLLGLPNTLGIPESWKAADAGLIHRVHQPSSVAEFAVLQDMIRKHRSASISPDDCSNPSASSDESLWHLSELRQLEMFYREYDPLRSFSDLRRVSDGKSSAMWTTERVVRKISDEVEVAALETRVRELRKEYSCKDKILVEIEYLESQIKEEKLKKSSASHKVDKPLTPSKSAISSTRGTENGDTPASTRQEGGKISLVSKDGKNKKVRGKKSKLNLPYFGRSY